MLLSGDVDQDICKQYRELNSYTPSSQLTMFSQQNEYSSLQQAHKVMQNMIPEVRGLFPQVERLLRVLLVYPATSCTTKRSFSSLRRLKTVLRDTMT
jgi:hAT family C-terminal dimerisation region